VEEVGEMTAAPEPEWERAPTGRRVFRWMNDRVRDTQQNWPVPVYDLICECGDSNCLRVLSIDRTIYDQIVATPTHFVVLPGHERPEFEHIIDARQTHVVVQPRQVLGGTDGSS
jgi:hypothetical protein